MKLRRIDVSRLPGGDSGFALDELAPGLNVVLGPNGSGKSSLCLAIQATLFDGVSPPPDTEMTSYWERSDDSETLRAELSDGVRWQRDGVDVDAPRVPAGHLASVYRLGLRDLLAPDDPKDAELARQIKIQIAGGFDLASLSPDAPTSRFAQKEMHALREANSALARLRGDRRLLSQEEEELFSLGAELAAAEAAGKRAELLGHAEALARKRAALSEIDRRIADLGAPAHVLERMTGGEIDDFDGSEARLADADRALEELLGGLQDAESKRAATELPSGPLADDTLKTLVARAVELRELDVACLRHAEELATACAQCEDAARTLAGDLPGDDPSVIDAGAVEELIALVERDLAIRERRLVIEARLGETREDAGAGVATVIDGLRRGADWLRDWLASPAPGPRLSIPVRIFLALLGMGAWLGLGLMFAPDARWLGLSGFLAGGLLGALLSMRSASADGARRRDVETRWAETGLDPPDVFDGESVRRRLVELDAELAAHSRRQLDAEQADRLHGEAADLARREATLWAEMQVQRERLGVSARLSQGAVSDLLARIGRWRDAAGREAGAIGRLEVARGLRERLVARMGEDAGHDFAVAAAGAEVQVFVQQLATRCGRWRTEDDRANDLRSAMDTQRTAREGLRKQRADLLERCAVEPDADASRLRVALTQRLAQWRDYCALANDRKSCRGAADQLREALHDHPKLQTLSLSESEDQLAAAKLLAQEVAELAKRIGDIRARVRVASEGRDVELAVARAEEAHAELLHKRDELAETVVARLILQEIEREYEEQTRPEVLQRASDLFSQFTHHRYTLSLDRSGESSRFRAVEADSLRGLSLAALSDGTRMQLLLAARLAFTTGVEGDEPLPLFLDEALTASDPERFRAVTQALVELAASGRQIFYLTCKSSDAELFAAVCRELRAPEPRVIDLAHERRIAAAIDAPLRLQVPASEPVPSPDGMDAAAYGELLCVNAPDPYAPVEALHLFHVLRDELPLLHRLLAEARVEQIGPWRVLCRSGAAARILAPEQIRRVEEGARVAECLLAAWRIGRGLPVDRAVLVRSGAVSEAFIEPLADLAASLGGRADDLIDALERRDDPRAQRFRADKRTELTSYLADSGCLDLRPPLDLAGLRARTLGDYLGTAKGSFVTAEGSSARAEGSSSRAEGSLTKAEGSDKASPALEISTVHAIVDALLAVIGEPPILGEELEVRS